MLLRCLTWTDFNRWKKLRGSRFSCRKIQIYHTSVLKRGESSLATKETARPRVKVTHSTEADPCEISHHRSNISNCLS